MTGRDILGYDDDEDEESKDEEFEDGPSFEELQMEWQTRETLENAESRARAKTTTASYASAVEKFILWLRKHLTQPSVKAVMVQDDGDVWQLDAAKLALSMEDSANVYTNYTFSYKKGMNSLRKSGLGHIKTLRSGLGDIFAKKKVALSQIALTKLGKWQKSRRRDDMAAKMRDVDPVKFSNARSSLPYDAYEKIAHLMAIEDDPLLHVMFVWQWNCIARVSNIQTVSFNHME